MMNKFGGNGQNMLIMKTLEKFKARPMLLPVIGEQPANSYRISDGNDLVTQTQRKKPKERCCMLWKLSIKALFSNIGCIFIVILYMIMGGYLFMFLESDNEIKACMKSYNNYQERLKRSVINAQVIGSLGYDSAIITDLITQSYEQFANEIYKLGFDPTTNCSAIGIEGGPLPKWSIASSIFFSATIMTTIGYGNMYPATNWGKIICIIYALLGIPIMLLYLTKIGEIMASLFRFTYLNMCCFKCFVKPTETPSYSLNSLRDKKSQEETEEADDDVYVTIPISVVLVVVSVYIIIGSTVFLIWETDWTLIDGAYFSFITLSTIGFGDLVPGSNKFDESETIVEIMIGAVYSIVGLAILSMCLNLIQDELTAKFYWLAMKLKILDKEKEDSD